MTHVTYERPRIKKLEIMRTYCIAQGTLFSALWWPINKWEGNPEKRGYMYMYEPSLVAQKACLQCRRHGFDLQVGKIPWRREWQPTPVFWRMPWTEEPGWLQSMRLQKVGHDQATSSFTFHVYVWLFHFAIQEKVTQHCKATILQKRLI